MQWAHILLRQNWRTDWYTITNVHWQSNSFIAPFLSQFTTPRNRNSKSQANDLPDTVQNLLLIFLFWTIVEPNSGPSVRNTDPTKNVFIFSKLWNKNRYSFLRFHMDTGNMEGSTQECAVNHSLGLWKRTSLQNLFSFFDYTSFSLTACKEENHSLCWQTALLTMK